MKTHLLKTAIILMVLSLMISCSSIECSLKSNEFPDGLIERSMAEQMQDYYIAMNKDRYLQYSNLSFSEEQLNLPNKEKIEIISNSLKSNMRQKSIFQFTENSKDIDNTDVVFLLDNLVDYFCYVEREFKTLKKGDSQGAGSQESIDYSKYNLEDVGVRIYYGAKVDKNNRERQNELSTTVFLVPVVKLDPKKHDVQRILEARYLKGDLQDLEEHFLGSSENANHESFENYLSNIQTLPYPIYIDILEIAPLNFGHARRPPTLYVGSIEREDIGGE